MVEVRVYYSFRLVESDREFNFERHVEFTRVPCVGEVLYIENNPCTVELVSWKITGSISEPSISCRGLAADIDRIVRLDRAGFKPVEEVLEDSN